MFKNLTHFVCCALFALCFGCQKQSEPPRLSVAQIEDILPACCTLGTNGIDLASGFVIAHKTPGLDVTNRYLVSAFHVFSGLAESRQPIYARFGTGRQERIRINFLPAVYHDEKCDLVIMPFSNETAALNIDSDDGLARIDGKIVALSTPETFGNDGIALGTDLFSAGLAASFDRLKTDPSESSLMATFGKVAAIPQTAIFSCPTNGVRRITPDKCPYGIQLVGDFHSEHGMSGSPVFAKVTSPNGQAIWSWVGVLSAQMPAMRKDEKLHIVKDPSKVRMNAQGQIDGPNELYYFRAGPPKSIIQTLAPLRELLIEADDALLKAAQNQP